MPDFKSTTRDVRNILDDFNRKGVDAVVLDLRRNGGGSLNEAISLTGLFINEGPVVQVKDADGRVQPYDDADPGMAWSGPLVVLISKFSASASEILAGAIQDYGRGLIVGDHSTHGKGTVQSLMDLGQQLFRTPQCAGHGALKITMQQFYRPNGDSTQKRGVLADIELPSLTTHLDVGEADLDYPVEFDKVEPLDYKHFDYVNPAVCDQLRQLSQQRVQASEKFQKVVRNIARYKEQKAKKYVTLNEEKFLKERAELNADKEEEKAIEKHSELNNGDRARLLSRRGPGHRRRLPESRYLASQPGVPEPAMTAAETQFSLQRRWYLRKSTAKTSGSSSVGRASASQAECRGFEPLLPLLH